MGRGKRIITKLILSVTFFLALSLQNCMAETVLDSIPSEASEGNVILGMKGQYMTDQQAVLDRINEIRWEACQEGVWDPRNESRRLTEADYVPIKWSRELEQIARIRAAEAALTIGHKRLTNKSIWTVTCNGQQSWGEVLAWNDTTSVTKGIEQFYEEKADWVGQNTSAVTGHYTSMIDPDNTYVGMSTFYSKSFYYCNSTAGEFSSYAGSSEEGLPAYESYIQKVEVTGNDLKYSMDGTDLLYINEKTTVSLSASVADRFNNYSFCITDPVSFASSDEEVATVTADGIVEGHQKGTVDISASVNGTVLAKLSMQVSCHHKNELLYETEATCSSTGLKTYFCSLCGEENTEVIEKKPHAYQYAKDKNEDGTVTGICKWCNETITINPPTSFSVYWKNSEVNDGFYWSSVPKQNPSGSKIACYIQNVNGDTDYTKMVITSSDPYIVKVPNTVNANGVTNMKVVGSGIVQLTVAPYYNIEAGRTYTLRVGDTASASIAYAFVTLPQESYVYTGHQICPEPVVKMKDITLEKGTDYTVSYEQNTEEGTAAVIVKGAGVFGEEVRKEFSITRGVNVPQPTGVPTETPEPTQSAPPTGVPAETPEPTQSAPPTGVPTETPEPTQSAPPTVVPTETSEPTQSAPPTGVPAETPEPTQSAPPTVVPTKRPTSTTPVTDSTGTSFTVNGSNTDQNLQTTVKKPAKAAIKKVKNYKYKKNSFTVSWKKVSKARGYQVQIATDKKFRKNKKTRNSYGRSYVFSKLKAGKTYYVRVRAYVYDDNYKKVYGSWSKTKKIKMKK